MAQDVFSREVQYGGAFSADGAVVTFAGFSAGLLVQSMQWTYQQSIMRIYEVGSARVYLIAGRTKGQLSMSRVLGPTAIMPAFYTQYGNVCNAAGNNLTFNARVGCGGTTGGKSQTIGIYHAIIEGLSGGVENPEQMIIHETLQMQFLYLTIS